MIKTIVALCAFVSVASASPYDNAFLALKSVPMPQAKELDALLARPDGLALLSDGRVMSLLNQVQPALELFRRAAEQKNDGSLFGPKPETLNSHTPVPQYAEHVKLFKLLLLDARVDSLRKKRPLLERDLLAAVGFAIQVSEQKSGLLISDSVEAFGFLKAAPLVANSIRDPHTSPLYLKELARRLNRLFENQDFMKAALIELGERNKGTEREGLNLETAAQQQAKLSLFRRLLLRRFQDAEFFSRVYSLFDAAQDEQTRVFIEAFKRNDAKPIHEFLQARAAQISARQQQERQANPWSQFIHGLTASSPTAAKQEAAQAVIDTELSRPFQSLDKTIQHYHVFFCELNVLRTGVAVDLFRRSHRLPPRELSSLVPMYLSAIPQDSFNRFQPLRYTVSGKKFRVYSLGPDSWDGGLVSLDWKTYPADSDHGSVNILFSD